MIPSSLIRRFPDKTWEHRPDPCQRCASSVLHSVWDPLARARARARASGKGVRATTLTCCTSFAQCPSTTAKRPCILPSGVLPGAMADTVIRETLEAVRHPWGGIIGLPGQPVLPASEHPRLHPGVLDKGLTFCIAKGDLHDRRLHGLHQGRGRQEPARQDILHKIVDAFTKLAELPRYSHGAA